MYFSPQVGITICAAHATVIFLNISIFKRLLFRDISLTLSSVEYPEIETRLNASLQDIKLLSSFTL
jgi:hypothetical protein